MTKERFKKRWESDEDRGGITFEDIANCAREWGIEKRPYTKPIREIGYQVICAAGVLDAEDYKPEYSQTDELIG